MNTRASMQDDVRENQFQQEVVEIIKAKWPKLQCQVCKESDWQGQAIRYLGSVKVSNSFSAYPDMDKPESVEFVVPLCCKSCGYVVMFSCCHAIQAAQLKHLEQGP